MIVSKGNHSHTREAIIGDCLSGGAVVWAATLTSGRLILVGATTREDALLELHGDCGAPVARLELAGREHVEAYHLAGRRVPLGRL